MRPIRISIHRALIRTCAFILASAAAIACAQPAPDFSGQWKQDNDRCQLKRGGEVTLRIEHHEPELTVETTLSHGLQSPRHALQKYTTDGKVSQSMGADGDEFYTYVVWKDSSLFLSIEEHEDGRIIRTKETWSLIEDGATLERTRESADGTKQILFFSRQLQGAHAGER